MSEKLDFVRGSGNVFRDLGIADPDVRQLRAILAAAAADFSRIRNADLSRFTVDRLVRIINRLGARVEVKVRVRRRRTATHGVPA